MFHFNLLETGEIWSGTEAGVIKAWPWDVIAKSLSLTPEEKYMASCLVENAYIDLKNYVTVGNMFSLPTTDVKHMLADHCRAKVWSLTSMTFALWYDSKYKCHHISFSTSLTHGRLELIF